MSAENFHLLTPGRKTFVGSLLMFCVILMIASMDIYLPALPIMVEHFESKDNVLQLTILMNSVVSIFCGLFYGRLSDIYGRRNVTIVAMGFFSIGSFMCCFTDSLPFFFFSRIVQAIGAGPIAILVPVVLGDLFKGPRFAKYMATYGLLFPFTWVMAPLVGAYVMYYWGWQSILTSFFAVVLITTILVIAIMPETFPNKGEKRGKLSVKLTLQKAASISANKAFLCHSLGHIIPITIYAILVSNLVFVFVGGFSFDPVTFSHLQVIPVLFNLLGGFLYRGLIEKIGYNKSLILGRYGFLVYVSLSAICMFNVIPNQPYPILIIVCLATFSMPFTINPSSSRVFEIAPPADRGLAVSVLSLLRNLFISLSVAFLFISRIV